MSITIESGDPHDPQATALLKASHALMQEMFPAESNHYLSIDDLCQPNIRFLIARDEMQTLGCGAVALKGDYGEIKSMFVAAEARGRGVADKLMDGLLATARVEGLQTLKLETGDTLHAAHKLYEKHGFTYCGPFGDYKEDPNSLFMERPL